MAVPIALQLYTLREALAGDFAGVVRQVAAMGYGGVETAGFEGTTVKAASQLFSELGLRVTSAHMPLPLGDRKNEVLDALDALACAAHGLWLPAPGSVRHAGPDSAHVRFAE